MAAMDPKATPVIEALRPGIFRDMKGKEWTLTCDDIAQLAASYDPVGAPSPVVIGHPKTDDPAFGWIGQAARGNDDKLRLTLRDLDPAFSAAVEAKRYRKVSVALFTPESPHNPKPGQWYIRHLGFLGAMPPAVTGLQPVQFAGSDEGVVEFAAPFEGPWWSVGSVLRRLREWIISEKDLATADQVLPDWQLSMIEDAARPQPDAAVSPGFSADPENPEAPGDTGGAAGGADPGTNSPVTPQEPTVTEQEAAQLRAANERLQAELAEHRKAVADKQREDRHAENATFAAGLVTQGRLVPASRERIVAVLDAVGELETQVEFAAGDQTLTEAPAVALRTVLSAMPAAVPLGERAAAEGEGDAGPAFAAPAGYQVDAAALELHNKALEYQKAHPDTDYLAAVSAVSKGA